jgi:hypothetical protein
VLVFFDKLSGGSRHVGKLASFRQSTKAPGSGIPATVIGRREHHVDFDLWAIPIDVPAQPASKFSTFDGEYLQEFRPSHPTLMVCISFKLAMIQRVCSESNGDGACPKASPIEKSGPKSRMTAKADRVIVPIPPAIL